MTEPVPEPRDEDAFDLAARFSQSNTHAFAF